MKVRRKHPSPLHHLHYTRDIPLDQRPHIRIIPPRTSSSSSSILFSIIRERNNTYPAPSCPHPPEPRSVNQPLYRSQNDIIVSKSWIPYDKPFHPPDIRRRIPYSRTHLRGRNGDIYPLVSRIRPLRPIRTGIPHHWRDPPPQKS